MGKKRRAKSGLLTNDSFACSSRSPRDAGFYGSWLTPDGTVCYEGRSKVIAEIFEVFFRGLWLERSSKTEFSKGGEKLPTVLALGINSFSGLCLGVLVL